MTQLEIIDETVAFYSADPGRRGMKDNLCAYQVIENGVEKKCGVGRCMTDEAIKEFGNSRDTVDEIFDLENMLAPQYQGHDNDFWKEIQVFHDSPPNWNETGLTPIGKRQVELLKASVTESKN